MSDDSVFKKIETPGVSRISREHYENGELTLDTGAAHVYYTAAGSGTLQVRDGSTCTLTTQAYTKRHEGGYVERAGQIFFSSMASSKNPGTILERVASIATFDSGQQHLLNITHHNFGGKHEIVRSGDFHDPKPPAIVNATEGKRDSVGVAAYAKETLSRAMGNPPRVLENSPEALQEIGETMAAVGIQCSKDGQPSTPLLTPDEVGRMAMQALGAPKLEKGR